MHRETEHHILWDSWLLRAPGLRNDMTYILAYEKSFTYNIKPKVLKFVLGIASNLHVSR